MPDGSLPDSVKNTQVPTGTVLAVGPGRRERGPLVPVDLKASDRVFLTGYAGLEIPEPSVTYRHEGRLALTIRLRRPGDPRAQRGLIRPRRLRPPEEEIITVLLKPAGTA